MPPTRSIDQEKTKNLPPSRVARTPRAADRAEKFESAVISAKADAVIAELVERRFSARSDIVDPKAWKATVARNVRDELGERIRGLIAAMPSRTVGSIVDEVEPPRTAPTTRRDRQAADADVVIAALVERGVVRPAPEAVTA